MTDDRSREIAGVLTAMNEGRVVKLPRVGKIRVFPTVREAVDFVQECQDAGIPASRIVKQCRVRGLH